MERINIAELLKDCPKGMELDCAIYENVTLVEVKEGYDYPIVIETPNGQMLFSKYGCFSKNELAKCVIFPKGKTTWEGFHKPFKDGDIVVTKTSNNFIFYSIYKGVENREVLTYVDYYLDGNRLIFNDNLCSLCLVDEIVEQKLATEEEKKELFDAIKENGYKWNPETKTLEKLPKFKVGDKVIHSERGGKKLTINGVYKTLYGVEEFDYGIPIENQDDYELAPNKFDVTTLQPFDKVLVRGFGGVWGINIFGFYDGNNKECPFYCIGQTDTGWNQCVPYWKNEHLLGTANDCDEYYKTWE